MSESTGGPCRRVQASAALVAVFAVAIALRAGPLHVSPLPFNPDGIVYSGHVRLARQAGRFPLFRMPVDDLHFTSLLTVASAVGSAVRSGPRGRPHWDERALPPPVAGRADSPRSARWSSSSVRR